MDVLLGDDCLLFILKQLNLNKRANVRLANKRFKRLCDSIKIEKLVVYERASPSSGKLKYTEEPIDLNDTVEVNDFQKFFGNKRILEQMRSIHILVIYGRVDSHIALNRTFDRLIYLKVRRVHLTNVILKSAQLRYLIIEDAFFAKPEELKARTSAKNYSFWFRPDLAGLKSIRCFESNGAFLIGFFAHCVKNALLSSIEELTFVLLDFKILRFLSDHFPTLKRINCNSIGYDNRPFMEIIGKVNFCTFEDDDLNMYRKDLKIYLFGIPYNKRSAFRLICFLKLYFATVFSLEIGSVEFTHPSGDNEWLKQLDLQVDLSGLFQLVRIFKTYNHFSTPCTIFNEFTNCQIMQINLSGRPNDYVKKCLDFFPNLNTILIPLWHDVTVDYDNDLLDLIPLKARQITCLCMDCWSEIDFEFLFSLSKLDTLRLALYHPIGEEVFIKLLRTLKRLEFVEVIFWRAPSYTNSVLNSYKEEINKCLNDELKIKNGSFRMEIHTRKEDQFVRYLYKRGMQMKEMQNDQLSSEKTGGVFNAIKHRQSNSASLAEKFLLDVI